MAIKCLTNRKCLIILGALWDKVYLLARDDRPSREGSALSVVLAGTSCPARTDK